ncbi:MAG: excinuclease ABC subunit UvrC [Rhodanobacteraceae bacterium]|nr:excinuclease ABC subunit UvrC [Rhodanobacteraceae bacterium]HQW80565.1 excinuclease ABC subunit UvrC [Pseudomonadota bacterium]
MTDATDSGFDGRAYARALTAAPGVYRMFDGSGSLLYVGKAKSLKKRVGSYFARPQLEPRIAAMVAQVTAIEVTVVRTESEALILENELIKSLNPRYNVMLKDSKGYPSIFISAQEFPRIAFHRGARKAKGRYFGPYPSTVAVRDSINRLQKLFRLRNCVDSFFQNRSRPCLQYQIKRCTAPCVGLVSAADYARDVRHAVMFLEGRSTDVIDELVKSMEQASADLAFENAAELRDEISRLRQMQAKQFVTGNEQDADVIGCVVRDGQACVQALFFRDNTSFGSHHWLLRATENAGAAEVLEAFVSQHYTELPVPRTLILSHDIDNADLIAEALSTKAGRKIELLRPQRGERVKLVELALRNAEIALGVRLGSDAMQRERWQALVPLLGLSEAPARIECFDISHTMGEGTVASCVVATEAGAQKSLYRRFNIRDVTAGDDYAAMRQAISRRFQRLVEEQADLPDLLLIDGGAGQVGKALEALRELGIEGVNVVGISKGPDRKPGFEELVLADSGRILRPRADAGGLLALQAVRDEAHRFAITGHRGRREKARTGSVLDEIEGIGARRRSALLKQFGGLHGIAGAGVEELMQVKGIDSALAERIYAHLHR